MCKCGKISRHRKLMTQLQELQQCWRNQRNRMKHQDTWTCYVWRQQQEELYGAAREFREDMKTEQYKQGKPVTEQGGRCDVRAERMQRQNFLTGPGLGNLHSSTQHRDLDTAGGVPLRKSFCFSSCFFLLIQDKRLFMIMLSLKSRGRQYKMSS